MKFNTSQTFSISKIIGYVLTIIIVVIFFFPLSITSLDISTWRSIGAVLVMLILWVTEVIPIYVTALLPLVLFPILQLMPINEVSINYGNPLIFLFLGGFIIAKAIEKNNLHLRISYKILSLFSIRHIGLGIFISASILSMWISNTATSLMLISIIQMIIHILNSKHDFFPSQSDKIKFEKLLLLLTAYGSNIGGMATIIGTPTNALYIGFIKEKYQITISFASWALIGIPITIILIFLTYFILEKFVFKIKFSNASLDKNLFQYNEPWKPAEKLTLIVFSLTILLWLTQPFIKKIFPFVDDNVIAMLMAISLFFIPLNFFKGEFLMDWKDVQEMKNVWGILLLFGGGLSLAKLIQKKGFGELIAKYSLNLKDFFIDIPEFLFLITIVFILTFTIIFLTEVTSNTAITASMLPIVAEILNALFSTNHILLLLVPLAASCAFMLPIATPPNAIIFSTEKLTIKEMVKSGFILNIIYSFFITLVVTIFFYLNK